MAKITQLRAREIFDSRGIPTIEVKLIMDDGRFVTAQAPSGESVGKYEKEELRDYDEKRLNGWGVRKAVAYINDLIGPKLVGIVCDKPEEIDYWLMKIDPSPNKNQLGVNTTLTISQAVFKASALVSGASYYQYCNQQFNRLFNKNVSVSRIPSPIFNIINGGKHGVKNLEFQEFQVIPLTSLSFTQSLDMGVEVYYQLKKVLEYRNAGVSVSEEGGFTPFLLTNYDALEFIKEGLVQKKLLLGVDVFFGLDLAASNFFKNGKYSLKDKQNTLKPQEYVQYLNEISKEFKVLVLEDPLEQDDFDNWKKINEQLEENIYVVGDDFLSGNKERLMRAIKENSCSGIVLKLNQTGTLYELFEIAHIAKEAGFKIIMSHRLGETTDSFVADLGVGLQADFVKFGAPVRGERVAKYNRLLEIEQELQLSSSGGI